MGLTVVGYVRVSTDDQFDSGAGLEAQRRTIREECQRRGWTLSAIHEDVASGRALNGRPGLKAALGALDGRGAAVLVVAKLEELATPWPAEDLDLRGGWIWSGFGPERLLERTRGVYGAAIEIYRELVQANFIALAPRLWHWRMLPARFVGRLDAGEPTTWEGHPSIDYHFDPLAAGASSEVDIVLGGPERRPADEKLFQQLRQLRPDAWEWMGLVSSSAVLDVFEPAPATKLAVGWLRSDLAAINFGSGTGRGPEW